MGMESLARSFDCPVDSREYTDLAESIWLGGSSLTVRFYLGRLLGRNLFRETNAEVEQRLVEYMSSLTSAAGGELVRGGQGWGIASEILRYRFEMQTKGTSALKRRSIAAIETFLSNPSLTLAELANELRTTEKQLARISGLTVARKQARFAPRGR